MDTALLLIAGIAAVVTVLAFLGILASLSSRAGQESRLQAFLREREGFAGRLLQVRQKRVEKLKALNARAEARIGGHPEPPAAGPKSGSAKQPESATTAAEPDFAEISKQAKENPDKAASILKTFLLPKNGS